MPTLIETIDIVIDELIVDPTIQSRAQFVDKPTAVDYAEDMANGAAFPAIHVFRDEAGALRLARGFPRIAAAKLAGKATFPAQIYAGGREDAILHAAGDNADHGLRRTNADKAHAVENVLLTKSGQAMSNHAIEAITRVTAPTIAKVRAHLEATGKISSQDVREGRDGRTYAIGNIGKAATADAQAGQRATLTALYDQHADYAGWVGEMNLKLDGMFHLLESAQVAMCARRGPSGGIMRWYQITPAGCAALERAPLGFVPEPPPSDYPGIDIVQSQVAAPASPVPDATPAKIFQENIPPAPPPATVIHFHNAADHWNALSEPWEDERYIYIGRAIPRHNLPESPWHNPYKIVGVDNPAARQQVIDLYRQHITPKVESGELDIETLRGKVLVCWCKSASAAEGVTPYPGMAEDMDTLQIWLDVMRDLYGLPERTEQSEAEAAPAPTPAELPDVLTWLPPLPWSLNTAYGYERIVAADGTDVGRLSHNAGAGLILSQTIVELMNARQTVEPDDALKEDDEIYYEEWTEGNQAHVWRKVRVERVKSRVMIYHPSKKRSMYVERRSLARRPFGVPLPPDDLPVEPVTQSESEVVHEPAL